MQEEEVKSLSGSTISAYAIAALAILALLLFLFTLPDFIRDADQIVNTTVLLLFLAGYLIYDFRPSRASPPRLNSSGLTWTLAGIGIALTTIFFGQGVWQSLLLFTAFSVLLRAVASCFLAESSKPLLRALFVAFTCFGFMLISLPILDMPLRLLAGRWSATIFTWLNQDVELGFLGDKLILLLNQTPYHVAAECNGFGLLGTTLILTAALLFYRKIHWVDSLLLLIAAVFVSLLGNLVRIFFILILAPHVGDHYMLMHEIVGIIAFYTFLGVQLWLVVGFGRSPLKRDPS